MNITASSLSVETSFDRTPLTSFKLVSGSLSVQASSSPGMVASISIETSFERFPSTSLKLKSCSLSLNTQYVPASIISLSIVVYKEGFTQVVDLVRGVSLLMIKKE